MGGTGRTTLGNKGMFYSMWLIVLPWLQWEWVMLSKGIVLHTQVS